MKDKQLYVWVRYALSICLCIISLASYCQSSCIVQNGQFVYECPISKKDSLLFEHYVSLGNEYLKNYKVDDSLLIYFILEYDSLTRYNLSFDNLRGNSLQNEIYGRDRMYDKPGIRIKISSNNYQPSEFLILLGYGVRHVKKLKKIRDSKLGDFFAEGDSICLSQKAIGKILKR